MELCEYPGMPEFLLNRATETLKPGKEWKFAIIQQLVSHPDIKNIAGTQLYHDLHYYISQGPWYTHAESRAVLRDEAV